MNEVWVFKCFFLGKYQPLLVNELKPKKVGIRLQQVNKTISIFSKYGELYKSVVFGQKCILQTRRGDHMEINFEYFQIQKWKLETEHKNRWKMGLFVSFPCLHSELWSLNCLKKCNFVLTLARNLKSVKAIICIQKVSLCIFRK